MSEHKTYTCDRCGAPFDRSYGGNDVRFGSRWLTLNRSVQRVYIGAFNLTGERHDHEPDMCADCDDSLAAWWQAPASDEPKETTT